MSSSVITTASKDVTTPYLTLEEFKNTINVTSTDKDAKIADILQDARQQVDAYLATLVDSTPLPPGTDTYVQAAKCVLFWAKSHWFENIYQLDKARYNMELFDAKIESLMKKIKADKPDRTRAVMVQGRDPLTDHIYLNVELDNYLTQEFV